MEPEDDRALGQTCFHSKLLVASIYCPSFARCPENYTMQAIASRLAGFLLAAVSGLLFVDNSTPMRPNMRMETHISCEGGFYL